ncbi:hypothetical protein FW774_16555 [Pedobacter sp. BS3]|uniref:hypothetical protein n=1 Tax=Pedobacter sp. BS3 TaxID=2567937 RepID=UPI0011ED2B72|nr:hypothetical protein [Pedobacter sp. BS3]TZF82295.1 hypothetical protein FW774_16555 [Pedobacter sp. BS3]
MKHVCLFLAGILLVLAAEAQVTARQIAADAAASALKRGNWIAGGDIGSTSYNFTSKVFQISISPSGGYFFTDNLVVGAILPLALTDYGDGHTFSYGITPFVRYYFPEGANSGSRWFIEGAAGLSDSSNSEGTNTPASLVTGAYVGYAHFVAKNIALEGKLGYNYSKADVDAGGNSSGIGLGFGLQIYLPW